MKSPGKRWWCAHVLAARRLLLKVLVLPNAAFATAADSGPVPDRSEKQNNVGGELYF